MGDCRFFSRGSEMYPFLLRLCREARKEILIASYSLHNDRASRQLTDVLAAKARVGVRVEVIFDDMGSWGDRREMLERLRACGVSAHLFRPRDSYLFRHPISYLYRNHARLFLIDRTWFGLGGMGIGEIYEDRPDFFLFFKLAAAERLADLFARYRELANRNFRLDPDGRFRPFPLQTGVEARISGPGREEWIYEWLLRSTIQAEKRLYVVATWFLPPRELLGELIAARRRGVDVQVVTPLKTDREKYDSFRALPIRDLLRAGIKWFGTPTYFHHKFFLADDTWCVGSANCDLLSLRRNYELNVAGRGGPILGELEKSRDLLIAGLRPKKRLPVPRLFRFLSGLTYDFLEFWFTPGLRYHRAPWLPEAD